MLVHHFSEPGDLVVDPCGGGFTTAVACRDLGRRCISCDIDEAAVIRGQDRLAGATSHSRAEQRTIVETSNTQLLRVILRRLEVLERDIRGTELANVDLNLIE